MFEIKKINRKNDRK